MFIFKSGKEDRSAWAEVFMFIHSGADLFTGLAFICSHPSLPFSFPRSFLSSHPFIFSLMAKSNTVTLLFSLVYAGVGSYRKPTHADTSRDQLGVEFAKQVNALSNDC